MFFYWVSNLNNAKKRGEGIPPSPRNEYPKLFATFILQMVS